MKKIHFAIMILFFSSGLLAQEKTTPTEPKKSAVVQFEQEHQPLYLDLVKQIQKEKGFIRNRKGKREGGVGTYRAGVWTYEKWLFIAIDVVNESNLDFEMKAVSFQNESTDKKRNVKLRQDYFVPVWQTPLEKVEKNSAKRLIFVFEKFSLVEKSDFQIGILEEVGQRDQVCIFPAIYINRARLIEPKQKLKR